MFHNGLVFSFFFFDILEYWTAMDMALTVTERGTFDLVNFDFRQN